MNYDHWRHYARGWLLRFIGRPAAACAAYLEAFRCDSSHLRTVQQLAAINAEQQLWDTAESWFEKVLAMQPADGDSWFNIGFVRERAGRAAAALVAFDTAVRLNPAQDRAWYGKGLAHARLGHHDAAAEALQEAARLQPMNGEAYYQWGMALHHAQRPDEIKAVVMQLVGFEPQRAKKLVQDAGRTDLLHLIPELPF
jgi:tetratricopeptide (TPR) repeat protein